MTPGRVALGISARVLTPLPGKLTPWSTAVWSDKRHSGRRSRCVPCCPATQPRQCVFPGSPTQGPQAGSLVFCIFWGLRCGDTPRDQQGHGRCLLEAARARPEASSPGAPVRLWGPGRIQGRVGVCTWA